MVEIPYEGLRMVAPFVEDMVYLPSCVQIEIFKTCLLTTKIRFIV